MRNTCIQLRGTCTLRVYETSCTEARRKTPGTHSAQPFCRFSEAPLREHFQFPVSLRGEKEDCNIYPTCRPFRVLPKGQGFVLSESKCWQVGSHWEQRWRLGLPCIHSPQPLSPFQWKRGGENLQLLTSPWGRKKLECASEITTFQGLPEIWVYVSPVLERWQDLAYSRCLGIT